MDRRTVVDIKTRLERMERVLTNAAGGYLWERIPINTRLIDELTSIEVGINIILADLEQATSERLDLREELNRLRGEIK